MTRSTKKEPSFAYLFFVGALFSTLFVVVYLLHNKTVIVNTPISSMSCQDLYDSLSVLPVDPSMERDSLENEYFNKCK
jgi:hypothetical protein